MENVNESTWSHLAGCKIPIDADRVEETARAILKARNASVMNGFLIYLKSVPSVSLPDAIMEQAVELSKGDVRRHLSDDELLQALDDVRLDSLTAEENERLNTMLGGMEPNVLLIPA